jgi:hypothetical protein
MSEAGERPDDPREREIPIVRLIGLIGWVVAALIVVAVPAVYYTIAIRAERESLQIETAFTAKAIQAIVFARPEMWEFETLRLLEIASSRTISDEEDERTIYDASGEIAVETKYKAPRDTRRGSSGRNDPSGISCGGRHSPASSESYPGSQYSSSSSRTRCACCIRLWRAYRRKRKRPK